MLGAQRCLILDLINILSALVALSANTYAVITGTKAIDILVFEWSFPFQKFCSDVTSTNFKYNCKIKKKTICIPQLFNGDETLP